MASKDYTLELDDKKKVTVRKFKAYKLIDIREFYVDKATNESKPGKKGISLSEASFRKLIESKDEILEAFEALDGDKKRAAENDADIEPKSDKKKIKLKALVSDSDEE